MCRVRDLVRTTLEGNMRRVVTAALLMFAARCAWAGPAEDAALHDAVLKLDVVAVRDALQRGADPNALSGTPAPLTPLKAMTYAILLVRTADADQRALTIARMLFSGGARLDRLDDSILFFPISKGSTELVALLLDRGASPTRRMEGYTPTELARKYSQPGVYELLIERGGIPVDDRTSAQAALIEAAGNGNVPAMQKAVEHGASINGTDPTGMTALVAAARVPAFDTRQAQTIAWLLEHGADPNGRGESGIRDIAGLPLHVFILANNLNPDPRVERARIARAEAALQRLLKAGARVSGMDESGRTPLHLAARFDNVRAAEILIRAGARVMARDSSGKTPLDYAETSAMIRLLKKGGARE